MSRFQGFCHLQGEFQGFFNGDGTGLYPIPQGIAIDEFHDEEVDTLEFLQTMDGGYVGVIQGSRSFASR
jgi:hypothetical protein